ncbi:MAG TPA: class I SAM-dependent methyltransferase [Rubrobacter sp.]|nr:class I SAM-dependent methyltransferase [Rubrobacter sp.]
MTYSDPEYVMRQYRDASNLEARIALHERFSTNPYGLPRWILDQFDLQNEASILEVGCGPGQLWTGNLDLLPKNWAITLTDASPGMVAEAEARLEPDGRFEFRVADVRELPFRDGRFDAVVANHMLYHVPDRGRAFSEITRVLKPDGNLYAATNGEGTQGEMGWMQQILDRSRPTDGYYFGNHLEFSLENGAEQLSPFFSEVTLRRYEDALHITEVRPLVDYLLSGSAADTAARELDADEFDRRVTELTGRLEKELTSRGAIHIAKDTGLFIARK